jgi:hypothetical protein
MIKREQEKKERINKEKQIKIKADKKMNKILTTKQLNAQSGLIPYFD